MDGSVDAEADDVADWSVPDTLPTEEGAPDTGTPVYEEACVDDAGPGELVQSCCGGRGCAGTCTDAAPSDADRSFCSCFGVAGGCPEGTRCCAVTMGCLPNGSGCHIGAH
jgi:hypothetical protein